MFAQPEPIVESEIQALLRRLAEGSGYVVARGTEWCLYSRRNGFARPLDRVAPALVKALRDRGHLVERAGGGLEALASRRAASGRLTDHRPPRPDEGQAIIELPGVNEAESPLAWLRSRKDKSGRPLISAEQFLAGERLRGDYERSCMERRITTSWESPMGGGRSDINISDAALTARQNVQDALEEVGPELASMLVQVCCLAAGIEQAERLLELPQRSGKAVLGLALTGLARHYGFLGAGARRRTGLGHWGLGDYRPAIPAAGKS